MSGRGLLIGDVSVSDWRGAHGGGLGSRGHNPRPIDILRLRELDNQFQGRVRSRVSTIVAVDEEVFTSEVVIGAVLVPGASASKVARRGMSSAMRNGSVIGDVAIDHGRCFETSCPTTHVDPTL